MITSATIENFKGFKKLELPDLSRITLLGGKNNVGKTSVQEALFLFFDRLNAGMFFRHFGWRGLALNTLAPQDVCAPMFHNYQIEHKITITICENRTDEQAIEIKLDPSYPTNPVVQVPRADEKLLQATTDLTFYSAYALEFTYRSSSKTETTPLSFHIVMKSGTNLGQVELVPGERFDLAALAPPGVIFLGARQIVPPNDDAVRFGQLDIEGKQDTVIAFLNILEPRLKSLSVVQTKSGTLIHGDIGIGRKIPVSLMGEGMGRLLSIILAIATTRDGIVFIDEFESGLHYSIMERVWDAVSRAACEFNCQIMATTHSYECLQAAHEGVAKAGLADEFRYVRLDRRDDDIVAKTYKHEVLGAAINVPLEVR